MNILLVINEPLLLDAMKFMLVAQGHCVTTAATTEEALRVLPALEIDLLVASLNMNPDGAEPVVQAAREKRPSLPILLVAGSFREDAERRILRMNVVFWQTGRDMVSFTHAIQRALLH